MATARSQEVICRLVEDSTLKLETETGHYPDLSGLLVCADTLMVIDDEAWKLQLYNRHDGKLLATSHRLESRPECVCLISNTEVAVILDNSKIEILSFKSIDDVKRVKTLDARTGFYESHAVAKVKSMDKVVVSGNKVDHIMYWCIVSITDGQVDSIHQISKRGLVSHLAMKDNTIYISLWADDYFDDTGVYAYDIFNPHTRKFLYQNYKLNSPFGLTADTWGFIFVCNWDSDSIHHLTDRGELVTIHAVSSGTSDLFYEDQHGVLNITSSWSNAITRYRLEHLHQSDKSI